MATGPVSQDIELHYNTDALYEFGAGVDLTGAALQLVALPWLLAWEGRPLADLFAPAYGPPATPVDAPGMYLVAGLGPGTHGGAALAITDAPGGRFTFKMTAADTRVLMRDEPAAGPYTARLVRHGASGRGGNMPFRIDATLAGMAGSVPVVFGVVRWRDP
jgi:hypothetical protein